MSKQKRKRTSCSAADKMPIVLKGMEPGIDVASLCRQEVVIPTQYYTWKKLLVSSAEAVFGVKLQRSPRRNQKPIHPSIRASPASVHHIVRTSSRTQHRGTPTRTRSDLVSEPLRSTVGMAAVSNSHRVRVPFH
jgi:hypothetical protein